MYSLRARVHLGYEFIFIEKSVLLFLPQVMWWVMLLPLDARQRMRELAAARCKEGKGVGGILENQLPPKQRSWGSPWGFWILASQLCRFKKPMLGDASYCRWFLYYFARETPSFALWPHLVQVRGWLMENEVTSVSRCVPSPF